jgi:hypothetical protein
MPMDSDTIIKLTGLLKKIDIFQKDLKSLRDKLSRSVGQQRRNKARRRKTR